MYLFVYLFSSEIIVATYTNLVNIRGALYKWSESFVEEMSVSR